MVSYKEILDFLDLSSMESLSPAEQALQYIYEHHLPYPHAEQIPAVQQILKDEPASALIVSSICNNLPTDPLLRASKIFAPNETVKVQTHLRYHPPIQHGHDFYEIQYLIKGTFRQKIGEAEVMLQAGDFCFISPFVEHTLGLCDRDTLLVNLLIQKSAFPHSFLRLLSFSNLISSYFMRSLYSEESIPFLVNHCGSDLDILYQICRLLATQRKSGPYAPHLKETQFDELFFSILQNHSSDFAPAAGISKTSRRLLEILNYIQQNYDTVTLPILAEKFNYNKSYLSRVLQQQTGRSFTEMVRELRFHKAMELIRSTELSIEEIILSVGYTDRSYFYREFKKKFQITPAEWRMQKAML